MFSKSAFRPSQANTICLEIRSVTFQTLCVVGSVRMTFVINKHIEVLKRLLFRTCEDSTQNQNICCAHALLFSVRECRVLTVSK